MLGNATTGDLKFPFRSSRVSFQEMPPTALLWPVVCVFVYSRYCLSYIPFARAAVKNCATSCLAWGASAAPDLSPVLFSNCVFLRLFVVQFSVHALSMSNIVCWAFLHWSFFGHDLSKQLYGFLTKNKSAKIVKSFILYSLDFSAFAWFPFFHCLGGLLYYTAVNAESRIFFEFFFTGLCASVISCLILLFCLLESCSGRVKLYVSRVLSLSWLCCFVCRYFELMVFIVCCKLSFICACACMWTSRRLSRSLSLMPIASCLS